MSQVAREIRRLRKEKGWTQTELAVYAGSSQPTINQIESGARNPSTRTLEKIAGALGIEVADLFPKAQAPLPLENLDDFLVEARRVRAFLERTPSEEKRVYELDKATEIVRGYATRWAMEIDHIEEEGTFPYGRSIEMRVMWERLSDSLRNDGTLDYTGQIEMGRVEASVKERAAGGRLTYALIDMFDLMRRMLQVEHTNRQRGGEEAGALERLEAEFPTVAAPVKHRDARGLV